MIHGILVILYIYLPFCLPWPILLVAIFALYIRTLKYTHSKRESLSYQMCGGPVTSVSISLTRLTKTI